MGHEGPAMGPKGFQKITFDAIFVFIVFVFELDAVCFVFNIRNMIG